MTSRWIVGALVLMIGSIIMIVLSSSYFQPLFKTGFDSMPENAMGGSVVNVDGNGKIISRYTIRRADEIREADELALKGSIAMADEKYGEAISNYFNALKKLPHWRQAELRRNAYRRQFWNAVKKSVGF